jgi:uncharacterized protein
MLNQAKKLLSETGELTIKVFVTPKSAKNEIVKLEISPKQEIEIKAKIKGVPEKGKVNQNLIDFLAKEFKTAKSNILLKYGQKNRHKTLIISI